MATALYPKSQLEIERRESQAANEYEELAADLEALCESGLIEAVRDPYNRVRYQVKAEQ